MARYEVSDELWARIQLPLDDRACLNGILFVLLTGIRWTERPQQLGYGSGMTRWRRLRAGPRPACATSSTPCCWPNSMQAIRSTGPARRSTPPTFGPNGEDAIGPSPVDRARPAASTTS
jgi:transposase